MRLARASATRRCSRVRAGRPGPLQIVGPGRGRPDAAGRTARPGHRARHAAAARPRRLALIEAIPKQDPSNPAVGQTIDRLRAGAARRRACRRRGRREPRPPEGAVGEDTAGDRRRARRSGFLLLLVALQAPLIAAVGVLTNLLATGAAFGVAKLVFQDGARHWRCSASSPRASSTPGARCSSSR